MADPVLRRARRRQALAKGAIAGAAALTIAALLLIVGYILVRGFWSSRIVERPGMSFGVPLAADDGTDVSVIVNAEVRVTSLTYDDLRSMYTGQLLDWSGIAEQDLAVTAFALPREDAVGAWLAGYLVGAEGRLGRLVPVLHTPEEMLRRVASTPGAVGFVPRESLGGSAARRARRVAIKDVAVVAHRGVGELKNNVRLSRLSEAEVGRIVRGEVPSWGEVGGIDLPLTLVWPAAGGPLEAAVLAAGYVKPAACLQASSPGGEAALIAATPGGVGFARAPQIGSADVMTVKIERRESGPNLSWHYLVERPRQSGKTGGISSIIINTLLMIGLTVLFSTPVGVMAAIYLVEYSRQGRLVRILRIGTETLAGVPSIIFGLFGFIFFVQILKMGIGLLSGTLTLTMMILPTIIRVTEESLKSVPRSLREAGLGLGATRLQTILALVIPAAAPGILTGVILGIGRAVGETAALIYTMGADYSLASGLSSSTRVLAVHLYLMIAEGVTFERAFAAATVLILIVLIVNLVARRMVERLSRRLLGS